MLRTDVLIVGGGPVGLLLAYELARRNVGFRLIELEDEPDVDAGMVLQPRTLELLDLVGVGADRLSQNAHALNGADLYGKGGSVRIARLPFSRVPSRHRHMMLPSAGNVVTALDHAVQRAGGRGRDRAELLSLHEEQGSVVARLRQADGRIEVVGAGWIVGCGTGLEVVRTLAGVAGQGRHSARAAVVADIRLQGDLDRSHLHIFSHPEGPLTLVPLGRDRARIIVDDPVAQFRASPGVDELQALVHRRARPDLKLRQPALISLVRAGGAAVGPSRRGRVFLIGDLAALGSALGDDVLNAAMQDAFNLGWKLALAAEGRASERLLDSFERERRPVATALARKMERFTRLAALKSPAAQTVRDHVVRLATMLPSVRDLLSSSLAGLRLDYRGSDIVLDRPVRGATLRAGDYCPDFKFPSAGTGDHLYRRFCGGDHVALVAGDGAAKAMPALREAVERCGDRFGLAASLPEPSSALTGEEPSLYLIRPDGYIGLRVALADDVSGALADYWSRIGAPAPQERRAIRVALTGEEAAPMFATG